MVAKKEARPRAVAAVGDGREEATEARDDSTSFEDLARQYVAAERRYFGDSRIEAYFTDHARACAAAGRRFSTYERAEWLRWYKPSDSKGRDIEVNNSDVPIIARLTLERVPEAERFMELRKSKFDAVYQARRASRGA